MLLKRNFIGCTKLHERKFSSYAMLQEEKFSSCDMSQQKTKIKTTRYHNIENCWGYNSLQDRKFFKIMIPHKIKKKNDVMIHYKIEKFLSCVYYNFKKIMRLWIFDFPFLEKCIALYAWNFYNYTLYHNEDNFSCNFLSI